MASTEYTRFDDEIQRDRYMFDCATVAGFLVFILSPLTNYLSIYLSIHLSVYLSLTHSVSLVCDMKNDTDETERIQAIIIASDTFKIISDALRENFKSSQLSRGASK